ncbi:MAG: flavodoxin family protein [Spirochaetes bacterium]|nr:flavodoxin family protein [Spirochaetota bacterium]
MKKIVIVNGSPRRNGTSAQMCQSLVRGIAKAKGDASLFYLHGMNIRPCSACDKCRKKKTGVCVTHADDMRELYPLLSKADALVIASPIYWFTMSAQTKLFVDRLYPLGGVTPGLLKGTKIGLMFAFGGEDAFDSGAVNAIRAFQDAFSYIGCPIVDIINTSDIGDGTSREAKAALAKAYALGQVLARGR